MTKIWLLDIGYKPGTSEIHLWGIKDSGERILAVDRSFRQYLYTTYGDKKMAEEELRKFHNLRLEKVTGRIFGREIDLLKIFFEDGSEDVNKLANRLRRRGLRVFEDDIRLSSKYLIDQPVKPSSWHDVELSEHDNGVSEISSINFVSNEPIPELKVLSLHMVALPTKGSPNPKKDPIILMTLVDSMGVTYLEGEESKILQKFVEYVQEKDPDVIAGFDSNEWMWPYIMKRAKHIGVSLSVGRGGSSPHRSLYGHVSIEGRASLDLKDMVDEIPELQLESLEELAEYFGLRKIEEFTELTDPELPAAWRQNLQLVKNYSRERAEAIYHLTTQEILGYAIALSSLTGIPLDHVLTAAVGFRVEAYLMKEAHKRGEVIPPRRERRPSGYVGGYVWKPKPGLVEDVIVLDFKSMYPNIMVKYNVSPDTLIHSGEEIKDFYEAPDVGHRFRKEPPGLYKEALLRLIQYRDSIKERLKKVDQERKKILRAQEKAVKVITNAMYGYAGWVGARWYVKEVAEAAAAWGRWIVKTAAKIAEELGFEIVYGDTDSLFVKNIPEKTSLLVESIQRRTGVEIKLEKHYVRLLFTEAKKKYAGLTRDGELEIVGLEAVRGDWSRAAKKLQKEIIEVVLRELDVEKAERIWSRRTRELKEGKVPLRELIIWKKITKPLDEYAVLAPHVVAAQILRDKGFRVDVGGKIGYIVERGEGKIRDRVSPFPFVNKENVDLEYYVEHQLNPVVERILKVVSQNFAKPGSRKMGLRRFMS